MRDRRHLAKLALVLVEGCLRDDAAADAMLVDTFETVEEAAAAHAYLTGFLLQDLAAARGEPVAHTVERIRRMLGSLPG